MAEENKTSDEEFKINIESGDPESGGENDEKTEAAQTEAEEPSEETAGETAEEAGEAAEEEAGGTGDEELKDEPSEDASAKKKWKPGRKEKKELAKKDEEIAALTDKYKRTLAEYDNFRRRTEKEKADLYGFAVRDVMTKILPVLDNLERGVAAVPEDGKDDPVAQGMEKILRQFEKALDDVGVKPIETAGKTFDPAYHNAVMHVDDDSFGENEIVEEFQKGYTYRDGVVRHSMVKVAN